MSAVFDEAPSDMVVRAKQAQLRLVELSEDPSPKASWWVEVTRCLDQVGDAVRDVPGGVVDLTGVTDQLRLDAPNLLGRWTRLAGERDSLLDLVTRTRIQAGELAGDPSAVRRVAGAVQDLLRRLGRFDEATSDVLLDAYDQDLGGE